MPRYKLTIEYNGAPFCGWQRQKDQPSVQQSIEEAIAGFSGEEVSIATAGRTDTGVHATGQIAHVDLSKNWDANRIREALNYHLRPLPISILKSEAVEDEFHARFSATQRHYRYRILNRRPPLALARGLFWHVKRPLEVDTMHEAAQRLLGKHDFTTFRHVHCQAKSPIKTMNKLNVSRRGDEIEITCASRSFLHNQVRSIVGSLVEVGIGKWSADDMEAALQSKDRARCGPVAPPEGLYLERVIYGEQT